MTGKREADSPYGMLQLPPDRPVQRLWLPYEGLHQYRYSDAAGAEHVIFASDADSTRAHLRNAEGLGLRNVGFWHYGAVTPEMWQAVREWSTGQLD